MRKLKSLGPENLELLKPHHLGWFNSVYLCVEVTPTEALWELRHHYLDKSINKTQGKPLGCHSKTSDKTSL